MPEATAAAQTPNEAHEVPVPDDTRALSTLARIDYENAIVKALDAVDGPARDRTGEQWARAVLEDAPAEMRYALTRGWSQLGLQLGPMQSDQHVLGWAVRHSTPDSALLAGGSPSTLQGELLVEHRQGTLLFASFIQHGSDEARARWAAVEHMHTPAMCRLVDEAVFRAS
jgi:hypothetical protein